MHIASVTARRAGTSNDIIRLTIDALNKIARGTIQRESPPPFQSPRLRDVLVETDRAGRVWPAWAGRRYSVNRGGITAVNDATADQQ